MKQYVLVKRSKEWSSLNHCPMWRFTWYSPDDSTVWETTVDESYSNYTKNGWADLAAETNPYGVYTNLTRTQRKTKEGLPVISADSKPNCLNRCKDEQQALRVMSLDLESKASGSSYDRFF